MNITLNKASEQMHKLYNTNENFKSYVDKLRVKHLYSLDEALNLSIVREKARYELNRY